MKETLLKITLTAFMLFVFADITFVFLNIWDCIPQELIDKLVKTLGLFTAVSLVASGAIAEMMDD